MADQDIAVGDTSYFPLFGSSYGDDIQFPIFKCTLSNFDAMSINDSGLIVGSSNGRAATMTLGGCPAYVPNVSIADVVADDGDMLIQTAQTSFVWSKGRISEIPLPTGYDSPTYQIDALSLNNNGKVVGEILQRSSERLVAGFEYSSSHSVDVESLFPPHSGWTVLVATAINGRDEIAGIGILANQYGGFALTH